MIFPLVVVGQGTLPTTGSTMTAPVRREICVRIIEQMAAFAMRLQSVTKVGRSLAQPCFALAIPPSTTLTTHALAVLRDTKILPREWVAVDAMSLTRLNRGRVGAPQDVLPVSHGLEMVGVDAECHAAQVVERESGRQRAVPFFPRPPMSLRHLSRAWQRKRSVLAAVAGASSSRPEPTVSRASFRDLLPESFVGVTVRRHKRIITKGGVGIGSAF